MANTIQIKRGTACSSALAEGELGYNLSKNILYIGNNGNKAIGGSGAFLPLSGGTLTGSLTLSNGTNSVAVKVNRTVGDSVYTIATYNDQNGNVSILYNKDGDTLNKIMFYSDKTALMKPLTIKSGGTGVTTEKDLRNLVHNSYGDADIANTVDVFTLAPGVYHLEETSSTDKNYPIAESRVTIFVYGQFRAGTAATDGYPNGYWVIRVLYGSGKEYINYRYWSAWKGWQQVHNGFNAVPINKGGTGATTAEGARTTLGITPENIGALKKSGDTATGQMNFSTITVNNANAYLNNGSLKFNTALMGIAYVATKDGTSIYIRPDQDLDLFQIVMVPSGGQAFEAFGIKTDGTPMFHKPLGVQFGGTNAANAVDARKNLGAFGSIGTNPVTTTATDTTTTWKDKGLGYAWYNQSGQLNNQPSSYGFLLNYAHSSDIFQIWRAQSGGPTYWRSGNGSGWGNTWAKIYDELNKPTASELGVLPLAGGTMTGTITLHSTGFKTSSTSGYYTNQYGNFIHQVATTNQSWNICNNAGASKFSVDFESGYVTAKGLVNGTPISQNWILTSRSGAFRVETAATGSAAAAALSMKVKDGAWAIANLATSSSLYFVFGTDENYNAGTNSSQTYYINTDGTYSGYIDWSHVKNPLVNIAQGGTGATSMLGAQANLLTTDSSKITATTNLNTILQTGRFKMEGNASTTYNWPADANGARCLVIQEGALNSSTYGYWKQTAHMLGQNRTYSRNYHWDRWMEWKMDYNEETLVYSTSQPANGYKGRIWLKPI